jgi:hypothetical protein
MVKKSVGRVGNTVLRKKKIKIKNHLLRKGIRRIAQKILYTIFFAFHTQSGGIYAKRKSE